ncbi:MAG TPA: hypothetical protein VG165_03435 [Solirubrobacteraceae bacterium]|jgi:hypothetical protein|nr:hypothetical protein [Solirubrobacteraceae bacterium]
MRWRSRSLCLPVLAAAGLGCVAGLTISGGGTEQIGVLRAAGTQTLPFPLPRPSGMPAPTTTTGKTTSGSTATKPTAIKPTAIKPTAIKPTAKQSKGKGYPLPKPKTIGGTGSKSKPTNSNGGYSLGEGPRGPAGPAGPAGPVGAAGPQGPTGPVSNVVRSVTINWRDGVSLVDPTATASLPGLGSATLTCTAAAQSLTITPASTGSRLVVDTDTAQGAGTQGATSFVRSTTTSAPITVPVPNNGMIFATIGIEPVSGDGGTGPDPATMTLSSEWKLNDPNPVNNFCFMAAQFVGKP